MDKFNDDDLFQQVKEMETELEDSLKEMAQVFGAKRFNPSKIKDKVDFLNKLCPSMERFQRAYNNIVRLQEEIENREKK